MRNVAKEVLFRMGLSRFLPPAERRPVENEIPIRLCFRSIGFYENRGRTAAQLLTTLGAAKNCDCCRPALTPKPRAAQKDGLPPSGRYLRLWHGRRSAGPAPKVEMWLLAMVKAEPKFSTPVFQPRCRGSITTQPGSSACPESAKSARHAHRRETGRAGEASAR